MNPKRKKRLILVTGMVFGLSLAVGLTLVALRDNINLFYSPAEIQAGSAPEDRRIRAGGLVEYDSVKRDPASLRVDFRITDMEGSVPVVYEGILPDLFREGQGVVALGTLSGGVFTADQVLAKHDEEYMPPEVAEALERAGRLKKEREAGEGGYEGGYSESGYQKEGYGYSRNGDRDGKGDSDYGKGNGESDSDSSYQNDASGY